MRIIFVGVHNKPGLKPLCSSTKSGKVIDEVISHFDGIECLKTNLYDVDYMSVGDDAITLAADWHYRIKLMYGDVIVLLGKDVANGFTLPIRDIVEIIKVPHPAARKMERGVYVPLVVGMIKSKLKS